MRTVDPLGAISTSLYDNGSRRIAQIDALGNRTTTTLDAVARPLVVRNPWTSTYNAAGWKTFVADPLSRITQFVYDRDGRQAAVANPLSQRTTTVYDAASQVRRVPAGSMIAVCP